MPVIGRTINHGNEHLGLDFGAGDIGVTLHSSKDWKGVLISFEEIDPTPIGFSAADQIKEESDRNTVCSFVFTRPESITVVLKALIQAQEMLMKIDLDTPSKTSTP